jgi:hypothetical protein
MKKNLAVMVEMFFLMMAGVLIDRGRYGWSFAAIVVAGLAHLSKEAADRKRSGVDERVG